MFASSIRLGGIGVARLFIVTNIFLNNLVVKGKGPECPPPLPQSAIAKT